MNDLKSKEWKDIYALKISHKVNKNLIHTISQDIIKDINQSLNNLNEEGRFIIVKEDDSLNIFFKERKILKIVFSKLWITQGKFCIYKPNSDEHVMVVYDEKIQRYKATAYDNIYEKNTLGESILINYDFLDNIFCYLLTN